MMHHFTVESKVNEHKHRVNQINKNSWRNNEISKRRSSTSQPFMKIALAALLNKKI